MAAPGTDQEVHDIKMPLLAHLEELRKRILIVLAFIAVTFAVFMYFSQELMRAVERPLLLLGVKAQFDTLTAPFLSHMKAAFYAALFVTFPLTLAQLWLFIRPGLFKRERDLVWPFLIFSYPLFIGGALFFYFVVFPNAVEFLVRFDPELVPSLRIDDFLSFAITMLFVFGLVFELPLVSILLTRIGILTPRFLSRNRGYATIIIAIASAVLTPTPDVINMLMLMIPLMVLYEISIICSWFVKARPKAEEPK